MSYFLRVVAVVIVGLFLAATGCSGGTKPANAPPGAANTQPANAFKEGKVPLAESDLGFLHFALTGQVNGKDPETFPKDMEAGRTAIQVIDERIFERVKSGEYIVRWGAPLTDPVLAYEKNAPTQGGWVLRGNGRVEKLSAEEVKKLLGQ